MSKIVQQLLFGALLLSTLAWGCLSFWTAPLGLLWHMLHGNSTTLDGHSIHVTWDMWVHPYDRSIMMMRAAPRYSILSSRSGILILNRLRGPAADISRIYDRVARANEQPRAGFKFIDVRQFSAPKGSAFCWESQSLDSREITIDCYFDKDTLGATFTGSPSYRDDVYAAIQSAAGGAPGK